MGSVFDALLTASAGGSPRLRFSPGCPSASARVGAPESCKISHNDQALWGLFFFPEGKTLALTIIWWRGQSEGRTRSLEHRRVQLLLLPWHRSSPLPRELLLPRASSCAGGKAPGREALGNCRKLSSSPADVVPRPFQMICWVCDP